MTDLDKLIDAVERGCALPLSFICLTPEDHRQAFRAYNGSLDAAKELHDALLPGWEWNLASDGVASVWGNGPTIVSRSKGTSRAWLIAILKAYKAINAT